MGYTTEFTGAFKITPKVDTPIVLRLDNWLSSRHYKRVFPSNLDDQTLFGSPGQHGEFIMPSITDTLNATIVAKIDPVSNPHRLRVLDKESECLGHSKGEVYDYNMPPNSIPSLWSDVIIVQGIDEDCSYLMWDQAEKAYSMDFWFNYITKILTSLGYKVEGAINAQGEEESDQWEVYCNEDGDVVLNDFWSKTPTYVEESEAAFDHLALSEAELDVNVAKIIISSNTNL